MSIDATITMENSAGVAQSVVDQLRDLTAAAVARWSAVLAGNSTTNITVSILTTTSSGRADGGNETNVFVGTHDGNNVYEPGTAYELRTGMQVTQSGADIHITIASDYLLNELFLDPTPDTAGDIPLDRTDGLSVLTHEIGHGLGFIGYYNEASDSFAFNANTPYDTHLVLRGGEVYFDGPNVRAIYGDAIPLTNNNYSHYGNTNEYPGTSTDPLTGLMNGVVYYRGYRYSISPLDLAVLADNGIGTIQNDTFVVDYMHEFNGGAGLDTVSFAAGTPGVTVSLAIVGAQNSGGAGSVTLVDIENLTGTAFADTLTGSAAANVLRGGGGDNLLFGGDGNDTLVGGAGNDTLNGGGNTDAASYASAAAAVTVSLAITAVQNTVGAGNDRLLGIESLTGSNFNDTLTGNAGGNTLIGGAGNDSLDGGAGSDTASYATTTAAVAVSLALQGTAQNTGGAGTDTLLNFENLTGGNGNDLLTGNGGANILTGNAGNDIMNGGGGDDYMIGGVGIDTVTYADATGDIALSLSTSLAQATGGSGSDRVTGIENLIGSDFADNFFGNALVNVLNGGGGNDKLNGLGGSDTLVGGGGGDTFQFTTLLGATNIDTITDFTHASDRIALSHTVFTGLAAGALAAGAYNTGSAATQADDRIIYNGATGALLFDRDGSGSGYAAVQFATLQTGLTLSARDFIVT